MFQKACGQYKVLCVFQTTSTVCFANIYLSKRVDYEAQSQHTIILRTTDQTGRFLTQKFQIGIVNVNDAPKVSEEKQFLM